MYAFSAGPGGDQTAVLRDPQRPRRRGSVALRPRQGCLRASRGAVGRRPAAAADREFVELGREIGGTPARWSWPPRSGCRSRASRTPSGRVADKANHGARDVVAGCTHGARRGLAASSAAAPPSQRERRSDTPPWRPTGGLSPLHCADCRDQCMRSRPGGLPHKPALSASALLPPEEVASWLASAFAVVSSPFLRLNGDANLPATEVAAPAIGLSFGRPRRRVCIRIRRCRRVSTVMAVTLRDCRDCSSVHDFADVSATCRVGRVFGGPRRILRWGMVAAVFRYR